MLVKGDLEVGHLVRPFQISIPAESAFYPVYPPDLENTPKIKSFCEWLVAAAG